MTDNHTTSRVSRAANRPAKITVVTPPPAPPPPVVNAASKSDTVIKLLLRAKGATPIELIAATDWQPHSLRAFLSGLRKKGREVVREERKAGGYAYRIVVDKAAVLTGAVAETPSEAASTGAAASTDAADAVPAGQPAPDGEVA